MKQIISILMIAATLTLAACGNKQKNTTSDTTGSTPVKPRIEGETIDGLRQGPWVSYYPNGMVWSECTYVDGLEEGTYRAYRPNGHPYYVGHYTKGKPSGTWEYYDDEGNLVATEKYD